MCVIQLHCATLCDPSDRSVWSLQYVSRFAVSNSESYKFGEPVTDQTYLKRFIELDRTVSAASGAERRGSRSNTNRPGKRLCGTRRAPRVGLVCRAGRGWRGCLSSRSWRRWRLMIGRLRRVRGMIVSLFSCHRILIGAFQQIGSRLADIASMFAASLSGVARNCSATTCDGSTG
jgi:hypothetical protein